MHMGGRVMTTATLATFLAPCLLGIAPWPSTYHDNIDANLKDIEASKTGHGRWPRVRFRDEAIFPSLGGVRPQPPVEFKM